MSLNTIPTHPEADSYVTIQEADNYTASLNDTSAWTDLTIEQKEAQLKRATKQIDTLRINKKPYFSYPAYNRKEQALKFPTVVVEHSRAGSINSATTNTLVDTARASNNNEPDDIWNDGAVIIKTGNSKGETKKISDFNATTGTITIEDNWETTPEAGDSYLLISEILNLVKYATIEQALFNLKRDKDSETAKISGVKSYRIGDLSENFGESRGFGQGQVKVTDEAKGYLRGLYSIIGNFK